MIVLGLVVNNFRNIKKAHFKFSPKFNLVRGRNAQGKTNLLEAIHFFSLGRSFRTRRTDELVMAGEDYAFLGLNGKSDLGVEFNIEAGMEKGGRVRASVNGTRLSGLSEVIGIMPTVVFTPEDVSLSSGPPLNRRVYLDYTAAQVSPAFLRDLKDFRKVLRNRNSLLRRWMEKGKEPGELGDWDEMFVEKGSAVVRGREEVADEIERIAEGMYGEFLPGGERLSVKYVCSFNEEGGDPETALREALDGVREAESRRGYTLTGPHYDDMIIHLGDFELRRFGSQGRKRLVAIVLKLAQAEMIMERREERPVVLLDDIFSELDGVTAARIRSLLSDKYQSFITSPKDEVYAVEADGVLTFVVEGGEFSPA